MEAFSLPCVFRNKTENRRFAIWTPVLTKDSYFSLWAWHMPLTEETHWLNTAVSANTASVLVVFSGVLLDISCSFKIFIEKWMCLESELKPRPLGVWGAVWVAPCVNKSLWLFMWKVKLQGFCFYALPDRLWFEHFTRGFFSNIQKLNRFAGLLILSEGMTSICSNIEYSHTFEYITGKSLYTDNQMFNLNTYLVLL